MNVHIGRAEISLYLSMKFASSGSGSSVSQAVKPRLESIVSGLQTGDPQPTEPPLRSGGYRVGDRGAGRIRRARLVLDNPSLNDGADNVVKSVVNRADGAVT